MLFFCFSYVIINGWKWRLNYENTVSYTQGTEGMFDYSITSNIECCAFQRLWCPLLAKSCTQGFADNRKAE